MSNADFFRRRSLTQGAVRSFLSSSTKLYIVCQSAGAFVEGFTVDFRSLIADTGVPAAPEEGVTIGGVFVFFLSTGVSGCSVLTRLVDLDGVIETTVVDVELNRGVRYMVTIGITKEDATAEGGFRAVEQRKE